MAFKDKPTRAFWNVEHAQEEEDHGDPVDQGQPVPVEEGAGHEGEQDPDAAHELDETAQDPTHVCAGYFDYVNCGDGQLKTKTHTTEKPIKRIKILHFHINLSNSLVDIQYSHFDTFIMISNTSMQ